MRHAHYVGHGSGYHAPDDAMLSSEGRQDTIAMARFLPSAAGIVSSPLPRALQTAEILAEHSGVPRLGAISDLREWRSPSAVRGVPPADFPEDYAEWRSRRTHEPASRYGDGESLQELSERATRVRAGLTALAERQGPLLVVSHKMLLRALTLSGGPSPVFDPAGRDNWPFLEFRALDRES
ncbi:histidine phosphatase family protein [Nocardiopsis sp. FR4]|uniref:histidine phosphatase family protein n=1 Tax=Nocardiopsis sp. FR4 TaxID=2605985 RepID=UPI001F455160|nr:histidine phosphatase family protein [Nocardiopsis sp. FR4]